MQTLENVKKIISFIQYKDWIFVVLTKGDGFLIQVQFLGEDTDGSGKTELQKCRKWFISQHSGDSEIIRSCFLAIRQAEEHELCERFLYKGQQIYNPHLDMDRMADFIIAKPFETRPEPAINLLHDDIKYNPIGILLNTPIEKCGIKEFSYRREIKSRALNTADRANIHFLHQLVSLQKTDLYRVRNTGTQTVECWDKFLKSIKLKFGFPVEKYGFPKTIIPPRESQIQTVK